jgi:hypothetical protein
MPVWEVPTGSEANAPAAFIPSASRYGWGYHGRGTTFKSAYSHPMTSGYRFLPPPPTAICNRLHRDKQV